MVMRYTVIGVTEIRLPNLTIDQKELTDGMVQDHQIGNQGCFLQIIIDSLLPT